ncbi:hypothetical protein IB278_04340 [Variovorax sp. VRV01]|uniref:hypothetical protein n=1 Tax=Variovorax sp. VRV01 TaxID=2769259 RepID=UPI001787025E|nr:hypothetical protein [Variovorax sp. VRV01]MBD9663187.1 hypothetical protein [Variovorax sp. VRV01]
MRISRTFAESACAFFLAIVYFFLSLRFYDYYTAGDLLIYRRFYDELNGAAILGVPFLQSNYTNSSEPLYGLLMWIGSNLGVDHDFYLSIFNAALIFVLVLWMMRERVGVAAQILILTNFYLFVLLTGAERLKFSYLLILLSLVMTTVVLRRLTAVGALFAHFQTLLLYAGRFAPNVFSFWWRQSVIKKIVGLLFLFVFSFGFWVLFSDALLGKYLAYEKDEFNFFDILNLLMLVLLVLYITKDKLRNFISLLVFVAFGLALGSERVNMIAVTLCMFLIIKDHRTKNLAFLSLLAYLSFKSIGFFADVVSYGTGFVN